jgi:hypothetical protein
MGRQGSGQRFFAPCSVGVQRSLGLLGLLALTGCGLLSREQPQSTAKPGDLLVQVGEQRVVLVQPFRGGEPNGLFDGVVKISGGSQPEQLLQVNAICSVPDDPQWPSYDNLYGTPLRSAAAAEGRKGDTSWQVLFYFNGRKVVKMGKDPGAWLGRLHDNLCRHGDFDDRKIAKKS